MESGEIKNIKHPFFTYGGYVSFSPDGTRFVVSSDVKDGYSFWVVDIATEDTLFTQNYSYNSPYPDGDPPLTKIAKWSNNGGFIVGVSQEPVEILIYNVETFEIEKRIFLGEFDPINAFDISFDDNYICIVSNKYFYYYDVKNNISIINKSIGSNIIFANGNYNYIKSTNKLSSYNINGDLLYEYSFLNPYNAENFDIDIDDTLIINGNGRRYLTLINAKWHPTVINDPEEDKQYNIEQTESELVITYNPAEVQLSKITLTDISGKVISEFAEHNLSGNYSINTSQYPSGAYLLNLEVNGAAHTEKIVIGR